MSSDNSNNEMCYFSGTDTCLENLISEYFKKHRIAPGLIKSVSITPDPQVDGLITSATVTILHRENNKPPGERFTPCTPVVIFDRRVSNFCKRVKDAHNGTSLRSWFHHQTRSTDGMHIRIDIFAV